MMPLPRPRRLDDTLALLIALAVLGGLVASLVWLVRSEPAHVPSVEVAWPASKPALEDPRP